MKRREGIGVDTKARIQALMRERNWTMYELAKRSGVAQTTIANLYVRNNEPSLSTLRALCDAFGRQPVPVFCRGRYVGADAPAAAAAYAVGRADKASAGNAAGDYEGNEKMKK